MTKYYLFFCCRSDIFFYFNCIFINFKSGLIVRLVIRNKKKAIICDLWLDCTFSRATTITKRTITCDKSLVKSNQHIDEQDTSMKVEGIFLSLYVISPKLNIVYFEKIRLYFNDSSEISERYQCIEWETWVRL